MSASVQPHRWQPTRLPHPWDSPGKNTGVGCHFLLQCMTVKSEREVGQSCLTLSDPMDCSPPGSSAYGILQARALEWGAIAFCSPVMSFVLLWASCSALGVSWCHCSLSSYFCFSCVCFSLSLHPFPSWNVEVRGSKEISKMLGEHICLDLEKFTVSLEDKTKKTHYDPFYSGRQQRVLWDQQGPIVESEQSSERVCGCYELCLKYGLVRSWFVRLQQRQHKGQQHVWFIMMGIEEIQ